MDRPGAGDRPGGGDPRMAGTSRRPLRPLGFSFRQTRPGVRSRTIHATRRTGAGRRGGPVAGPAERGIRATRGSGDTFGGFHRHERDSQRAERVSRLLPLLPAPRTGQRGHRDAGRPHHHQPPCRGKQECHPRHPHSGGRGTRNLRRDPDRLATVLRYRRPADRFGPA